MKQNQPGSKVPPPPSLLWITPVSEPQYEVPDASVGPTLCLLQMTLASYICLSVCGLEWVKAKWFLCLQHCLQYLEIVFPPEPLRGNQMQIISGNMQASFPQRRGLRLQIPTSRLASPLLFSPTGPCMKLKCHVHSPEKCSPPTVHFDQTCHTFPTVTDYLSTSLLAGNWHQMSSSQADVLGP